MPNPDPRKPKSIEVPPERGAWKRRRDTVEEGEPAPSTDERGRPGKAGETLTENPNQRAVTNDGIPTRHATLR